LAPEVSAGNVRYVHTRSVISGEDVSMKDLIVAIKGAGEMATGVAHRLYRSGFHRIIMSEIERPLAVRRKVAFCEAVFEDEMVVEGVTARLIGKILEVHDTWSDGVIAVIVDPECAFLQELKTDVVIDATMMKREKASMRGEADFTIGIGPGFSAPEGVDAVVESNRGHHLGKVIYSGNAEPYTAVPGTIAGIAMQRVLRAPHKGKVKPVKNIGDMVTQGDLVLYVDTTPVCSEIPGIIRGLIRPIEVVAREKVGDVDPRGDASHCVTISDKARAIAGGVLEAIMNRYHV
jgi:xanthine dehydrogenase accessory factor